PGGRPVAAPPRRRRHPGPRWPRWSTLSSASPSGERRTAEGAPDDVSEDHVLIDVQTTRGEPPAHGAAIAHQEVHTLRIADDVDHLRDVDDHDTFVSGQDVVRRQVAMSHAASG